MIQEYNLLNKTCLSLKVDEFICILWYGMFGSQKIKKKGEKADITNSQKTLFKKFEFLDISIPSMPTYNKSFH